MILTKDEKLRAYYDENFQAEINKTLKIKKEFWTPNQHPHFREEEFNSCRYLEAKHNAYCKWHHIVYLYFFITKGEDVWFKYGIHDLSKNTQRKFNLKLDTECYSYFLKDWILVDSRRKAKYFEAEIGYKFEKYKKDFSKYGKRPLFSGYTECLDIRCYEDILDWFEYKKETNRTKK